MLVLTRRAGERVRVGPDVWVTVVSIDRNKVRLGFTGPREVEVYWEELAATREPHATRTTNRNCDEGIPER